MTYVRVYEVNRVLIWRRLRHFAYSVKVGMLGVLKESLAREFRREHELNSQVCSYVRREI